ncbi:MAG TPA: zinc-binding alcohol dehydrogenase family protein [Silvibacterium sp.]|nr:zinc-binding alcohol dehydrogenase family protein [Silvibacterium sp.]
MNAAVVEAFDRPPRYTSFADPVPSEKELLISVTAAAMHPIVRALAAGTHYGSTGKVNFIPGVDGAGRLPDGSRVYFGVTRPPYGTFAERAVTEAWLTLPLPDSVDDVTAAAMMNPAMSSWAALTARAKFVAGENVLILGATGIAGHLAVQIARRLGAGRVIAAGRNPEALAQAAVLGADVTIALGQERGELIAEFRRQISESKIDVVLDYLWGPPAESVLAAISEKGLSHESRRIRYVQIGNSAGPNISLHAATLRSSGLELLGSGFGSASLEQILQAVRAFLAAAEKSPFTISTKVVPLREVEAAWSKPERGSRLVFQP